MPAVKGRAADMAIGGMVWWNEVLEGVEVKDWLIVVVTYGG